MSINTINSSRNFGLDALRAFSILIVFIGHGTAHLLKNTMLPFFWHVDGVDFFFVLSGFLIGQIFIKDYLSNEVYSFSNMLFFWKRRWYRTLPAYYVTFCLIALLGLLGLTWITDFSLRGLFFIQNIFNPQPIFFSVSWSLSVEEWSYLLLPLSVYFFTSIFSASVRIPKKYISLLCILIFILLPLAYRIKISPYFIKMQDGYVWDMLFRKRVTTRMDSIFIGVLGAWIYLYYNKLFNKYKVIYFLLGLVIYIWNVFYSNSVFNHYTIGFTLNAMAIMLFLPLILCLPSPPFSIFQNFVYFISKISYSIYLIHFNIVLFAILSIYKVEKLHSAFLLILYFIISILLAYLSYSYIEQPFLKLRDKKS